MGSTMYNLLGTVMLLALTTLYFVLLSFVLCPLFFVLCSLSFVLIFMLHVNHNHFLRLNQRRPRMVEMKEMTMAMTKPKR